MSDTGTRKRKPNSQEAIAIEAVERGRETIASVANYAGWCLSEARMILDRLAHAGLLTETNGINMMTRSMKDT